MGHFQLLTAELSLPLPEPGEASQAFEERLALYGAGVAGASIEVFSAFFRVGAALSLAAAIPVLWMGGRRKETLR